MRNWDIDVAVITTAAPPWLTGPAYLTLNQAVGLADLGLRVAYVVPWVGERGQAWLWGEPRFPTRQAHLDWLAGEAARLGGTSIPAFFHYRGYASKSLRSIVPLEDVFRAAPPARAMVLCEPEHLGWYPFTSRRAAVDAETVLGVVMTNYAYYVGQQRLPAAAWLGRQATRLHRRLIRRHTDVAVPVSPAVHDVTDGHPSRSAQVTGVFAGYAGVPPVAPDRGGAFFLGRLVWEKGLETVVEVARRTGRTIDILGDGPDRAAIQAMAAERSAPLRFLGSCTAPWTRLADYRVFVNASLSEVLCTATAEALVAGRHVVLADCPANEPFRRYPNTHFFRDLDGAVAGLEQAMAEPPAPPDAVRRDFDWLHACRTLAALCGLALPPSPGTDNPSSRA